MDHYILYMYSDSEIRREYLNLKANLMIEQNPIKQVLIRIEMLNLFLEMNNRAKAKLPELETDEVSK